MWTLWKCWSTYFTRIWFLSRVYSYMTFQVWIQWKCCSTYFTRIWFFPCVCSYMPFQTWNMWKCRTTHLTWIWLLSSVCSHMPFQAWTIWKCGTTNFTIVWFRFLSFLCIHVSFQIKLLRFIYLTWARFLPNVCLAVCFDLGILWHCFLSIHACNTIYKFSQNADPHKNTFSVQHILACVFQLENYSSFLQLISVNKEEISLKKTKDINIIFNYKIRIHVVIYWKRKSQSLWSVMKNLG